MSYFKKTDRPRAYPPATIAAAVRHAVKTSICQAARSTGLSTFTVRRHLILAGHKPNRVGSPGAV